MLAPYDPYASRVPRDPRFGYFGSAPLPPWPILSTVGKGPKGDGIVIKAMVDSDGREYLEFWSTDPEATEPIYVSPKFPERKEDEGGETIGDLDKKLAATRVALSYATGLIENFLYAKDVLKRSWVFEFPWNEKFVEPFRNFQISSDRLRMRFSGTLGYPNYIVGACKQVLLDRDDPTGKCRKTPASIDTGGVQRQLIDTYLDKYFNNETEEGQGLTPRDIAREAGVIIPWSFPDGYIMYPLVTKDPTGLSSSKRFSCYRNIATRWTSYGTVCSPTFIPEELDDPEHGKYIGIPDFDPLKKYWLAPGAVRRRAVIAKKYIYLQKNYYSTDHDVTVVLPFGLSGGSLEPGDVTMYYGELVGNSQDFVASSWPPDSRVIDFTDSAAVNQKTWPTNINRRCSEEVARKAARVMLEFAMGNGRGLWMDNSTNGQPYVDPIYHEYVLNPEQWRLDYNIAYNDWVDETSSGNYYQATDRMIDWRPDNDMSPQLRGLFKYSRNNSTQFRVFPAIRPKGLTQDQLIDAVKNHDTEHTQGYYLKTFGTDCSASTSLAYFSPVNTWGYEKSEENQFWIPNLGGTQFAYGDLVAAAAPGVPLDLSQAKPGDIIGINQVYSGTDRRYDAAMATHVAMVVSTPSQQMITAADLPNLHYPVYEVPDYENPHANPDYDKKIKYWKKLTMDDVRTKVIVVHTASTSDACDSGGNPYKMYKDDNGDWQFVDQQHRPANPTFAPYIVSNNDAENWHRWISYRYLVRWSYPDEDSNTSHADYLREADPHTYIYRWISNLVEQVEKGIVNLFPTADLEAIAELDYDDIPGDNNGGDGQIPDDEANSVQPISDTRGLLRGAEPARDSTAFEHEETFSPDDEIA